MSEKFKNVRFALVTMLLFFCAAVQAQKISGNVKDALGEGVIGATIMEQGTQNGTVTDFDGNFTLTLKGKSHALIVSYVGMKTETVSVAGKTNVNIVLQDDNATLDELVVVGYGTMKKSDVTGSVSSVNTEQLNAKGAASVMGNLQGSNSGVNITMSGRVGDSPNIEIRGKSSINGSVSPLYVVDGVMCDDIDWLNPQDIEKIDILKDASSTAIYGSRATAGVVMVTTKSGATVAKNEKVNISYDGYFGWSKAVRMPEFLNASQYKDFRFQKFLTAVPSTAKSNNPIYEMTQGNFGTALVERATGSGDYAVLDLINKGVDVNWPDEITRNGSQQNHYLAVSGNSKSTSYNFGLGYNKEKGIYEGDEQQKVNFKGSIESEFNKYIKAGFMFNAAYSTLSQASSEAIQNAYAMASLCRPYDENGEYFLQPGYVENFGSESSQTNFTKTYNPLLTQKNNVNDRTSWRLLGNAFVQITPMKGLTVKTTFSPNYRQVRNGDYTGFINPKTDDYYNPDSKYNGMAYVANQSNFSWTWDNVVNYNTKFAEKHSLGVMGLYSVQKNTQEYQRTGASGLTEDVLWWNLNAGEIMGEYDSSDATLKNYGLRNYYSSNSMISWAMRANYSYMDRYLLTATVRWDGSSKFADGNRWGCFPSVAAAWRITEESWMKSIDWISNLKLRVSYGVTGNCDGISNYQTLALRSEGVNYAYGDVVSTGYAAASIIDKNLKWEKSHEWNFGLDFGFLNNRIFGSIDVYTKTSKDLLFNVQLPLVAGGNKMMTNIGSVRNSGVELSLTTVNIKNKNWQWTTSFNFAHNKNEVKEIDGTSLSNKSGDTGSIFVGSPVNNVYGYEWAGIVTDKMMSLDAAQQALYKEKTGKDVSSVRSYDYYGDVYGWQEGAPILTDLNNDGKINEDDKKVWSSDPVWTGSFTSNLSYKNWDFSMSIYAKVNYKVKSGWLGKYAAQDQRGQGRLNVDYYIPAGTLISCDGVNDDGSYMNPVYQTSTHYGDYPIAAGGAQAWGNNYSSDVTAAMSYVNGSYVKCQNMTLGYTFPKKWLKPISCQHLRLYFTVTNPFVISGYKGFDPEWAGNSYTNDVPSTVTYQVGASIKF